MKSIILVLVVLSTLVSCNYLNTEDINCTTILEKERVVEKEGESYYLIYTDKGEFTIKDELLRGNFNSSNWYGSMKLGGKYSFSVGGFRSGFLSMYQNIHSKPRICK